MAALATLVPVTEVAPTQIGEVVITGAAVVATVTELETALTHSPVWVAYAVTAWPAVNAVRLDNVHAFEATVVVPTETAATNTSMEVPSASLLVPLTEVDPTQIGEETTGASVVLTVMALEAALWHAPVEVALAVITSEAANAETVAVQSPLPSAVVVPTEVVPAL